MSNHNQLLKSISVVLLLATATACSSMDVPFLYRPTMQQGNVFTPDMVNRLKVGMSEDEVHYIMGSPVLINVFSPSRSEYVYTLKPNKKPMQEKKVIVYFDHGRVSQIVQ